eukprot:403331832
MNEGLFENHNSPSKSVQQSNLKFFQNYPIDILPQAQPARSPIVNVNTVQKSGRKKGKDDEDELVIPAVPGDDDFPLYGTQNHKLKKSHFNKIQERNDEEFVDKLDDDYDPSNYILRPSKAQMDIDNQKKKHTTKVIVTKKMIKEAQQLGMPLKEYLKMLHREAKNLNLIKKGSDNQSISQKSHKSGSSQASSSNNQKSQESDSQDPQKSKQQSISHFIKSQKRYKQKQREEAKIRKKKLSQNVLEDDFLDMQKLGEIKSRRPSDDLNDRGYEDEKVQQNRQTPIREGKYLVRKRSQPIDQNEQQHNNFHDSSFQRRQILVNHREKLSEFDQNEGFTDKIKMSFNQKLTFATLLVFLLIYLVSLMTEFGYFMSSECGLPKPKFLPLIYEYVDQAFVKYLSDKGFAFLGLIISTVLFGECVIWINTYFYDANLLI